MSTCRPSHTEAPKGTRVDRVARLRQTLEKQRRVLSIAASAWPETEKPCRECTRHYEDLDTTRTLRTAFKGQRPAPALSTQHHSMSLSLMRCEKRRRRTFGVAAPHGAPKCGRFPVLSLRHLFFQHRIQKVTVGLASSMVFRPI